MASDPHVVTMNGSGPCFHFCLLHVTVCNILVRVRLCLLAASQRNGRLNSQFCEVGRGGEPGRVYPGPFLKYDVFFPP